MGFWDSFVNISVRNYRTVQPASKYPEQFSRFSSVMAGAEVFFDGSWHYINDSLVGHDSTKYSKSL